MALYSYGPLLYSATFQYNANGISGAQVGAVIPVTAVPEPTTMALAAIGLGIANALKYRRKARRIG